MSIHLRLNTPTWNKSATKADTKESWTSRSFSAGYQIFHKISSLKERKSRDCLCSPFKCANESSRTHCSPPRMPRPRFHQPVLMVNGTRVLVYIIHMTGKWSQSVKPAASDIGMLWKAWRARPAWRVYSLQVEVHCGSFLCADIKQRGLPWQQIIRTEWKRYNRSKRLCN